MDLFSIIAIIQSIIQMFAECEEREGRELTQAQAKRRIRRARFWQRRNIIDSMQDTSDLGWYAASRIVRREQRKLSDGGLEKLVLMCELNRDELEECCAAALPKSMNASETWNFAEFMEYADPNDIVIQRMEANSNQ